jgi:hypothetical protein
MNHWRCGRPEDAHAEWCSDGTPNDCSHCGGNPCRWWCDEAERSVVLNFGMPPTSLSTEYHRERNRRIAAGTWVWSAA